MLGWKIGWLQRRLGREIKKNQNLVYYRQMDHADKTLMAKVLSNLWRHNKKRTIVVAADGIGISDKENIHPTKVSSASFTPYVRPQIAPTVASFPPSAPALTNQQPRVLNNAPNIVFTMYAPK